MANQTQGGGNSTLWWGRQPPQNNYDPRDINSKPFVPITADPYNGVGERKRGAGYIINNRFLFTTLGLNLASEQSTSRSIEGHSASSKRTGGQLWCEGDFGMELIPNDLIHYYRVVQNKEPVKSGELATTAQISGADTTWAAQDFADGAWKLTGQGGETSDLNIPSKVTITLTDGSVGEIRIIGFRRIGLPDDEIRPVLEKISTPKSDDADTDDDTYESVNYFTKIKEIQFIPATAPASETARAKANNPIKTALTFSSDTHHTSIDGFGNNLSDGVTIMQRIGLVPFVAQDCLFNTFNVEISDTLDATAGVIGGPFFPRRTINGGFEEKLILPDTDDWFSQYPIQELDFQPAWGSLLRFDGEIVNVISCGIGVNLNLESKQYYRASRFRNKPKRSSTPREITSTPRVFFEHGEEAGDTFQKWEDRYVDNHTSEMTLDLYNWLDNGKEFHIKYTIREMQLIEVPTLSVEDVSDIERDLSFLATKAPEMKFEIWGNEYLE